MPADVIPFAPRFDPFSREAEAHYDTIVNHINGLRVQERNLERQATELERQFVQNELVGKSGRRRGKPLGPVGRRRRLTRLHALYLDLDDTRREQRRLRGHLDGLQSGLEAWASANFGTLVDRNSETAEP